MGQILNSKEFGELEFEKTWVMGTLHIGKLTGGGYAYVSGHPVTNKSEALDCIPPGEDQEDFLFWWENKDSMAAQAPRRLIVVAPNGDYMFDDGDPITTAQQLIDYFGPGPAVEAGLKWYAKKLLEREQIDKEADEILSTKAGKAGADKAKKGKSVKDRLAQAGHKVNVVTEEDAEEVALKD